MSNAALIAVELGKMAGPDLAAALSDLGKVPNVQKAQNIATLAAMIVASQVSIQTVQGYAGKGLAGRASPAFPDPAVQATVQATGAAAARAEAVALEAKGLASTLAAKVEEVRVATESVTQTLAKVQSAVESSRDNSAQVSAEIATQVAQAFAPIRAAAEANGTQTAVLNASAAPIGQASALQIFGVDARDVRGNPLMFDLWSDPSAPAVDPRFIWTEEIVKVLCAAQSCGGKVWMGGEKGTGKTETARQFAAKTGRAFTRINFRKFTTAEDYLGATALVNGNTQWGPGALLLSYCSTPGAVTLLDEISNIDPGEAAPMNGLLEPNGRVNMGGTVWSAAPGAMCFAADNTMGNGDQTGRYAGTRMMNAALLDRFPLKVAFTFLPLEREVDAVVKHTRCNRPVAEQVMRVITTARAKVQTGEVVSAPSIREVMAWVESMPILGVRKAWEVSVAASQPPESAVAIEAIYQAEVNEVEILKAM